MIRALRLASLCCLGLGLSAQTPPWQASGVRDPVDGRWVAVATAPGADAAAARAAAEQEARRLLAASARSRIEADLVEVVHERERGGRAESETEVKSSLRQTTDVELRRARTRRVDHRKNATGFEGYAEVEIAEGDLIPTTRLRAAARAEGAAALLRAAEEFEQDQLFALATQALLMARDRAPGPAVDLRLGQHHEQRGDLEEAVRWFAVVSTNDDDALAKLARDRLAAIRARVPTVAELARDVLALAEARRDASRLFANVARDGEKRPVQIEIREQGRQVLCSWIDDTLTLHYDASTTPIRSDGTLPLEPAADAPAAKLVLWSLPLEDPLWADLTEHGGGGTLPLRGDVPVERRMRVQKLLASLRAMDTPACVLDMGR